MLAGGVYLSLYTGDMDQNTKDIIDSLIFIKENMATKSDLAELSEKADRLSEKIEDVHIELRGKFESLDKRLDIEVVRRTKEGLPSRFVRQYTPIRTKPERRAKASAKVGHFPADRCKSRLARSCAPHGRD